MPALFINSFNMLTGSEVPLLKIALPIGISFYTFQTMSYTIDVYRGNVKAERNFINFAAYVTLFPQLVAGPIVRYETVAAELKERTVSFQRFSRGAVRFCIGLGKKVLLANSLASLVKLYDSATGHTVLMAWAAAIAIPLQIYFDFSGYSDMSIGAAAILGFWLPDNFRFPYRALSLTDFWRRWHISLSTWFRDYLYIPLGGNRKGTLRMYANNFITMLVAGLWHGASWMFVIWGALHGFGLCVHKFFSRQLHITIPSTLWGNTLSWLITYVYVCFAWSFFRSQSLTQLGTMYEKIVADFSWAYLSPFVYARPLWTVCLLGAMLTYLIPERTYTRLQLRFITLPWLAKFLLFIVCVQLTIEVAQEDVQPFIYGAF